MSQQVVVTGPGGLVRQTHPSRVRHTRGYAKSRQEYDRRRRLNTRSADDQAYMQILRGDPCAGCGHRPADGQERLAVDHIVPLKLGGRDHWPNYAPLCRRCNASKKNQPLLIWLAGRTHA